MKSKRQEELQKKTLSQPVYGWQLFYQRYGSRILLSITLAILAILVVRYRAASAQQRMFTAQTMAARAREDLSQLKQAMLLSTAPPEMLAVRRDQLTAQVLADLSEALGDSTDADANLRADAYTIRGDLYWTLANSPVFAEAATRPALATKDSPDTLLSEAEADYKHVISQYPNELMSWATAEFGLGAIAEDRADWEEARNRYEAIENRTDSPDMLRSAAQIRLGLLERIRQPVLVGPYPATAATSEPVAAMSPATAATTIPTVAPAIVPATQPAH